MLLPSVEGDKEGNWIVVDSGLYTVCISIYMMMLSGI